MSGPVSGAGGEVRRGKYLLISQKSQSRESSHDISHCSEVVLVTFINLNLNVIVFSTVHLLVPGACRGYAEIKDLDLIQ